MTTTATKTAGPTCPAWCEDRPNSHSEDTTGKRWGEWTHTATITETSEMKVWLVSVDTNAVREPVAGDDYGVFVEINQDRSLTAEQTRTIAAAMIKAADLIEGEH